MTELTRMEQLDQAVEQLLKRPSAAAQAGELEPLLRLAVALRELPDPNFKQRLRTQLQRKARMASTTQTTQATQTPTATATWLAPYLTVQPAEQVIDFIKNTFGAEEEARGIGSAGGLHCTLKVGDSTIMVGGGGRYEGPYFPTAIHIYVRDCDAAYQRALAGGATSLMPPRDQFYGERSASVRDMGGNQWFIATSLQGDYRPRGANDARLCLIPTGSDRLLEFTKRAFGAQEVEVHRVDAQSLEHMPSAKLGTIAHATVRLGESILELGEAHGPWQNMPTTIYLNVTDCDTAYAQAMAAGAKSLSAPADQPYGARVAAVRDEWGNQWYCSSPLKPVA